MYSFAVARVDQVVYKAFTGPDTTRFGFAFHQHLYFAPPIPLTMQLRIFT